MSTETQEKEIIVLKAVYGKQQGALTLNPSRDGATGELRGVTLLTEDQRKTAVRPVDATTTRKISDGLMLDLTKEADRIDWAWIKENKEIANSQDDAMMTPAALFYVDQPDKALNDRINVEKVRFKASALIMKAIEVDAASLKGICRLLGQNAEGMPEKDVEDYLFGKLKQADGPVKIIRAFEDPSRKTRLFFFKLLDTNVIKKETSGIYKYGEIILGTNTEAVLIWLNHVDNRDIVGKLWREAYKSDASTAPDLMAGLEKELA